METTLDRFGRVVIPKSVRDDLGLKPGETLSVEEREGGVVLRPLREKSCLAYKGHVLVLTGETLEDTTDIVRQHRDERIQELIRRSHGK